MSIQVYRGVFLTNRGDTIAEVEFDKAFSKIRLERPLLHEFGHQRCKEV